MAETFQFSGTGFGGETEGFEGRPVEPTAEIVAEERDVVTEAPQASAFTFSGTGFGGVGGVAGGPIMGQDEPIDEPIDEPAFAEPAPETPFAEEPAFQFSGTGFATPGAGRFRFPMPGTVEDEYGDIPPATFAEHPSIPGLRLTGGRIAELPPELTMEVPETFRKSHGRLSDDELQTLWYQTAATYNKVRDPKERVRLLGDFMSEWNPEVAERYGYKRGGHWEPEGFWKALDAIDKYIDRPLRALINTAWDMRKGFAAADLSDDIESPGLDQAWRMLNRNFSDDKGMIEDGEKALRSILLFANDAFSGFDDESALLSEGNYEAGEDALAEGMTRKGWAVAAPVLKLLTGASDEQIEREIEEAVNAGSEGGHFTLGLASLMLISPLNFLGGAGLARKGLSQAATSLLRGGVKLTPRGAILAGHLTEEAASQGRRLLVGELAAKYGEDSVSSLSVLSRRIDRADEAINARRGRIAELTHGDDAGTMALGGERVAVPEAARLADESSPLMGQVERITSIKDDLIRQFDEQLDAIRRREVTYQRKAPAGEMVETTIPASALREDAAFRASAAAAANTTEAVNQAFKFGVALRGQFAVKLLAEFQAMAQSVGVDLRTVNTMWARGLEAADKANGILVKVVPERALAKGDKFGDVAATNVIKSPEMAYIYERAAAGEFGVSARIAALKPEYNALETLLKKGVKGVPKFDELVATSAKELAKLQKTGIKFTPVRTGVGRAARLAAEGLRRGKAGVKRLRDPKRALLRGENIASNIDPASFALAHAIAKKIPWLDKVRQGAVGVGRLTRHPQIYTRRSVATGKLEAIERLHLEHPAVYYKSQKAERMRARTRNIIQARFPQIRQELLRISDDPEMIELMGHAAEMGWADPVSALSNLEEIVTVAAIRKLRETTDSILDSLVDVSTGKRSATVLSPEATARAIAALEKLRSVNAIEGATISGLRPGTKVDEAVRFPGYDDDLIVALQDELRTYGAESAELQRFRGEAPDFAPKSESMKERALKLSFIKKRLQVFSTFYESSLRSSIRLRTELKIAEIADIRAPEIAELQKKLLAMEERLRAVKSDELAPKEYMDFIEEAIGGAKVDIPDFHMDQVVQLTMKDFTPRWAAIAATIPEATLRLHMGAIYGELQKVYGTDANVLMNHLQVQADLAVRQGVVKTPEEWFYQMDLKVGGEAPSPTVGMLFQESEAAPLFYSVLGDVIRNKVGVTPAKRYRASTLAEDLRRVGVSEKLVDELDIDGWLYGQEKDLGTEARGASAQDAAVLDTEGRLFRGATEEDLAQNTPSKYKAYLDGIPEGKRGYAMPPGKFKVSRGDVENFLNNHPYLEAKGIHADEILNRLDQRANEFKVEGLTEFVQRKLGVKPQEVRATGFGRYMERLAKQGRETVSRGELEDFIDANAVELVDDFRGHYAYLNEKRVGPAHRMPEEQARGIVDEWRGTVEERLADDLGEPVEVISATYIDEGRGLIDVEYRDIDGAIATEVGPLSSYGLKRGDALKAERAESRLQDIETLRSAPPREADDAAAYARAEEAIAAAADPTAARREYFGDEAESMMRMEARQRALAENKWAMDDNYLFLISPGGEKNFELLVINPKGEAMSAMSGHHWPGLQGITGHIRANVRTDSAGRRVLYIEELQADNAQALSAARKTIDEATKPLGRVDEVVGAPVARMNDRDSLAVLRGLPEKDFEEVSSLVYPNRLEYAFDLRGKVDGKAQTKFEVVNRRLQQLSNALSRSHHDVRTLKDITHSEGWQALFLKRALKFAVVDADETIDAIAWTTGKTQRVRYDLTAPLHGKQQGKGLIEQYDNAMPNTARKLFEEKGAQSTKFKFDVTEAFDDAAVRAKKWEGETRTVRDPETGTEKTYDLYEGTVKKLDKTAPKALIGGKRTLEANGFVITDKLRQHVKDEAFELFQTKERARLGMMKVIENDRVLIQAFEGSNKSTIVHEVGHLLRRNLAKEDQAVVKDWLAGESKRLRALRPDELPADLKHLFPDGKVGSVVNDAGEFTPLGEELFARGFENYLATGKAPKGAPKQLREAFKKLKEWVTEAYKHILGRNDVKVNDEVRAVLDRYFLGKERPVKKRELWETPKSDIADGAAARAEWEASVVSAIKDPNIKVPLDVLVDFPEALLSSVAGHIGKATVAAVKSAKSFRVAKAKVTRLEEALRKAQREGTELERALNTKAIQGQLDKAQASLLTAVANAEKASRAARLSKSEMAALQRGIRRVKKAGEKKDYVIPEGTRDRRTLQAVQQLYKDRMANVVSEIQQEAFVVRKQADEQQRAILESLAPREQLSSAQREKLETIARLVGSSDIEAGVPTISRAVVDNLIKQMGDPKLIEKYNKQRAKILRLSADEQAVAGAALDAALYEKLSGLQVKAEAGVKMTPLQEAVAAVGLTPSQRVVKGLPGQKLSKVELKKAMDDIDTQMDELIEALKEVDYDLRSPNDVTRQFETAINSSFNNLEAARADWNIRLKAFEDDQAAKLVVGMTEGQRARVYKLVNNPDLHDIIGGKKIALSAMGERLASITSKIESLEAAGKDVPDHMLKTKTKLQRQIEILGDKESFETILEGARFIKSFFDDWLEDLRAKGILDETLSEEAFYARVSVGSYLPHMATWAAQNKVRALIGRGALPSTFTPGFAKFRKIEGTIAEINAAKRTQLAEEVIRHQASSGALGVEAKALADQSMSALRKHFDEAVAENPALQSWDSMVENARIEFGLDDMYNFFETDPLLLMERYHVAASKKMADAIFIEDILDMFPMGRQFEKLYGTGADIEAQRAGYVRLSKVDHLQSVLLAKLPSKLREFEPYIKQKLNEGTPLNEILAHLEANDITVGADVVAGFKTADVFVPTQIAEYLNWINGKDALWAKGSLPATVWDGVHAWMKGQATIVALAHIGRNFIGNTISSVQELGFAAVNPVNQFKAMRIWGSWGDDSLDSLVSIGKHEYTVKEWRQIFTEEGFYDVPLSTEFMMETVGLPGRRELATGKQLLTQTGMTLGGAAAGAALGAMFGLAPAGIFAGAAGALVLGRRWTGAKTVKGGSWFEKAIGKTSDEMARAPKEAIAAGGARLSGLVAGGIIGSAAGPLGSLAGAALFSKSMPDYMRMMGTLNQSVEAQARLSMAVAALEKGLSVDDALVSVNKALRDYSDLSPLEKNVLRRMFFFYTWEAGNFKFQLNWMKKNPRGAKMVQSFFNGLYKYQFDEEDMAAIPEQWRYRVVLKTGLGKVMAVSGLPMEPMMDILTRGKRSGNPRGLTMRVHPIPLTLAEWFFGGGKSVYYNKGWEELNNVRQLKNAPPAFKDIVGFPEEGDETWVPVYKNGALVGSRADYRADNASLFYLMQKFPGYRVLSQYMIMATDSFNSYAMDTAGGPEEQEELRARMWERILMFTAGYRVSNIDWDQQKSYAAWRLEQDLLHELEIRKRKARRKITRLNVKTGWTWPRQEIQAGVEGPFSK